MRRNFPASLLTALLVSAPFTFSQDRPAMSAQPNTVWVSADGKSEASPDLAMVEFHISAEAATAKAAYEQASQQAERTREILRRNGLEPQAAEIGYFAIQPRYDWKDPKRKLVGYEVSANVSVKVRDFAKIGPISQELADGAVGEGQSVNYTLENIESAKTKAVADAYNRARASAETVARISGRALGELSYASVDTFENVRPGPIPRVMARTAVEPQAAPPTQEFTPQNITVTAHVNAMFNLH